MIKSFYIVSAGGVPIYHYDLIEKKDAIADAILFSGLITAIQNLMVEVEIGQPRQVTTESNEVYLETAKCFGVVLIKELGDEFSTADVKKMLSNLMEEIKKIIPDEEACTYLDDEERVEIIKIVDKEILNWTELYKETDSIKEMKKGFW